MPIFLFWGIILLDLIIPFVPIMAIFFIYILLAKPPFFKKWVDEIYVPSKQGKI